MGPDLAVRAVHFAAPEGRGGALAGAVAFVDHGAVEEVFSEREQEVGGGVCCERRWG